MFVNEIQQLKPNLQNVKVPPEIARQILNELTIKESMLGKESLINTSQNDLGFKIFSRTMELLRHFWFSFLARADPAQVQRMEKLLAPMRQLLDSPGLFFKKEEEEERR